jgi:hypothetical protein
VDAVRGGGRVGEGGEVGGRGREAAAGAAALGAGAEVGGDGEAAAVVVR